MAKANILSRIFDRIKKDRTTETTSRFETLKQKAAEYSATRTKADNPNNKSTQSAAVPRTKVDNPTNKSTQSTAVTRTKVDNPIVSAVVKAVTPPTSALTKKANSLAQLLQDTLLSRQAEASTESAPTIPKPQMETDVLTIKQNLLRDKLKAALEKQRSTADEQEQSRTDDSPTDTPSVTRYGTVSIKLPDPSSDIYKTVAKLPEDFPGNEWDGMTAEQQRSELKQTDLTVQEQWLLLNANLPVGALQEVQKIRQAPPSVWHSSLQEELFIQSLWEKATASYLIKTNQHPSRLDPMAKNILLEMIEEDNPTSGTETIIGGNRGLLIDHDPTLLKSFASRFSKKTPEPAPSYRLGTDGKLEKNTVEIIYTSKGNSDFTEQAAYQRRMLELEGYRVVMHEVNSLAEFIEAWNSMDESAKAALIFAHSNGNSLIFEDLSPNQAISWNGKNKNDENIGNIRELEGPELDELYLMSCNTGNEVLMKHQNSNVADAFRDLPNVHTVYGYDGSMAYGNENPFLRVIDYILDNYDPRVSDKQDIFEEYVNQHHGNLQFHPDIKQLETPDGWILYDSREE